MNDLRPQPLWRGVAVALVTLFEADGVRVDAAATAAHARRLVELGVRGVLVAGSTGVVARSEPSSSHSQE